MSAHEEVCPECSNTNAEHKVWCDALDGRAYRESIFRKAKLFFPTDPMSTWKVSTRPRTIHVARCSCGAVRRAICADLPGENYVPAWMRESRARGYLTEDVLPDELRALSWDHRADCERVGQRDAGNSAAAGSPSMLVAKVTRSPSVHGEHHAES